MRPSKPVKEEFHNEQSFQTLGQLINLPPLELKKFSGQPDEYDNFVTTFNEVIGSTLSDPASKLIRLKSQLTGTALDSISMCRADGGEDGFTRAKTRAKRHAAHGEAMHIVRGVRGHAPPRKFFKTVQFGAF